MCSTGKPLVIVYTRVKRTMPHDMDKLFTICNMVRKDTPALHGCTGVLNI